MNALAEAALGLATVRPGDGAAGLVVAGCILAPPSVNLRSLRLAFSDGADDGAAARDAVPPGGTRRAPFGFTLSAPWPAGAADRGAALAAARVSAVTSDGATRDWPVLARSAPLPMAPWPGQTPRLGVALVTGFGQPADLRALVAAFEARTPEPHILLVADRDGSAESEGPLLLAAGIRRFAGRPDQSDAVMLERVRRFLLDAGGCDLVALFAPATVPSRRGWARDWSLAALLHEHAHADSRATEAGVRPGRGTWFDPARGMPHALGGSIATAAALTRAGPIATEGSAALVLASHAQRLARVTPGPADTLSLLTGDLEEWPTGGSDHFARRRRRPEIITPAAASLAEID